MTKLQAVTKTSFALHTLNFGTAGPGLGTVYAALERRGS